MEKLISYLSELSRQRLDDDFRVTDLFAVELDEGQEAALGAELRVVGDILEQKLILYELRFWK